MTLKLYNTRTRQKELFSPIEPKAVRMYVCGPTVYDFAHIGNARPAIVFDVLFRLLRHLYGAEHMVYARNITDVDDKINARAAEEGIPIRELTERTAAQYHADVAALGCLKPTFEPRATEYVSNNASEDMLRMIGRLIERGHAYEAEGHVLFSVATDPNYGKLARRSVEEMRAGARVEVAPYKRDPMDFVLWKPSSGSEPGWDSPWGFGRPGWHLECSAMSAALLGEVFDIHGGGIDLLFPHHENEVAQSTCAHGTTVMANVWMHNGHLQVEGEKMSKSLGNFVTIHDLLQEWPGQVIRLNMLRSHYRQPMDWTLKGLQESELILRRWHSELGDPSGMPDGDGYEGGLPGEDFMPALLDDLNTPLAITAIHQMRPENKIKALRLLGLDKPLTDPRLKAVDEGEIEERIKARITARKAKNWKEADRIRDELSAMGVALKDAKNPATGEIETTWEIAR
jgi:cysteinyl-tRNA synthetase